MRLPARFVAPFLFFLACLAPASPSLAQTLDANARASLIAEMKANPNALDKWQSGMQELMMNAVRQTDYLSRMAQMRSILELLVERLTLDAGKPLPEASQAILLYGSSLLDQGIFVVYEADPFIQGLRKQLYTRIMQLPGCTTDECSYLQAWASVMEAKMTPHEAQRTRLFDFAYRFYDRIIGNPPEKTTMPSLVMMRTSYIYTLAADAVLSNSATRRHRIFSKADALAKEVASYQQQSNELPDVLAEAVNRTLVRLNLSKAYCEASPARRRLYLAAAEKNRAAFAEKEDAVSQYLFQAEVAVIRGDWKNAMKNLHLIPVELRPYLLTVPFIRHAKNPMVVAYLNEILQMINQGAQEH